LGLAWFGFSDLHDFQQYFSYIVAVSFIGGGNRGNQRKPEMLELFEEVTKGVTRSRTNNAIVKRKVTKEQTTIYKTFLRKLKIE